MIITTQVIKDLKKVLRNNMVIQELTPGFVTARSRIEGFLFFNNGKITEEMTFVGVARYKDGDVLDSDYAAKIATCKMERNFYKVLRNCIRFQKELLDVSDLVSDSLDNCNYSVDSLTSSIKDITSNT